MKSIEIGNNSITYDEAGEGRTILLLPGWCQDHRLFKCIAPILATSYHVIALDWRGHDPDRRYDGDFTHKELVEDVNAFIDALKVDTVIPVSTSHGGWANIEVVQRLGIERAPKAVVIDWLMIDPGKTFLKRLEDLQVEENWLRGRKGFFESWIVDTDNQDVISHVNDEMASFDFEMWARSGREILREYRHWGYPLNRLAKLSPQRPITHIFSQPHDPAYKDAQDAFAREHGWFMPQKVAGTTHFPTLESPAVVAGLVKDFIEEAE
jgi:pimeloyl-ACP methyl ester carboxylesterase